MRVVRISANNIRVEFTEAELEKYGLDTALAEGEACAPVGAVKKILEAVKRESGIDYCGERVFIRMLRSCGGGDMVISRLGAHTDSAETAVLRFSCVGSLIAACRTMDKSIRADAYIGIGGAYLITADGNSDGYGERLVFSFAEEFVREHCRLVCAQNAAERLGAL